MRVSANALGNSESDGLRLQEILPTTPVTRTADSTGILDGCVFKLKLTSGKASGELFELLTRGN